MNTNPTAAERKPRQRKCRQCKSPFDPRNSAQIVCSVECAKEYGRIQSVKKVAKERKEAKAKLKTRGQHLKEAQAAFNAYIRARDAELPCISCARMHQGQWHAGHYRAVSVAPALRFHEDNVHKQCAPCNDHKHGNLIEYRAGLIHKIGRHAVEWLEGPHEPKHYSIPDLQEIKQKYLRMARELMKGLER